METLPVGIDPGDRHRAAIAETLANPIGALDLG